MRKYVFLIAILIPFCFLSQEVQTTKQKGKKRYGIGLLPSTAEHSYGLGIGLIGSETVCNRIFTKKSHGLNIQLLGQGFFGVFMIFKKELNFHNSDRKQIDYADSSSFKRVKHNGVLLSTFGTFSEEINGISISSWMNFNHKVNGLSMNLLVNNIHTLNGVTAGLYNSTYQTHGVQFGLINKTKKLRGFQFGLWNVNSQRKLPLINWHFK